MKNPTDLELDAAFAEHVAKPDFRLKMIARPTREHYRVFDPVSKQYNLPLPQYTQSADLVLPWLEKNGYWSNTFNSGKHIPIKERNWAEVFIGMKEYEAYAETFARAAVICLLRSKGIEVEFE